ncbi:MAG: type III restriction endonuclease subunit R [Patescibacteria group bacterium]|nr:MAG: type III restriction endonuclease subunit R [Patescibacteria group bacterium]
MSKSSKQQSLLPLVRALQLAVAAWREGGYKEGTSETTRRLLEWWFMEDHELADGKSFAFWQAQREAIEHLIYCYEVLEARSLYKLAQQLDVRIPIDPSADKWAKYAFKMATGSGKTMVMAMTIAWSYFNATKEKREDFTKHFVLIAPNLIVLDRLFGDSKNPEFFEGAIFKKFPFIPPEWLSDFQLDVIGPDEEREATRPATLYLLNWQKFIERENGEAENPVQDILGPKPPSEIAVSLAKLKDRLSHLSNVMVINDEAHRVWSEELVWYKAIENLHETVGLMCQLDFSATPKDQDGRLFTHIITDYNLGTAIEDNIVKRPKIAELENVPEIESENAAEKYRVQIDAGIKQWKVMKKTLEKAQKKPVIFFVTEDNTAADEVAEYLQTFPEFSGDKTLTIHSGRTKDQIAEKDLAKARKAAREIDSLDNPHNAIVSVLMLREGWDVKNVVVVVPLRSFSAKAKIFPEQTLGRGLRKMWPDRQELVEELIVIEHPEFHDLIEQALAEQGVKVEFTSLEEAYTPPIIIQVEEGKEKFDIEVPMLSGGLTHSVKGIEKLQPSALEKGLFDYDSLQARDVTLRKVDMLTKKEEAREVLEFPYADNPQMYIASITNAVLRFARIPGHFDKVVPQVKEYISKHLFDRKVDIANLETLKKLNHPKVRGAIISVFVDAINNLTIVSEEMRLEERKTRASEIKPFPWTKLAVAAQKCVLNFTPVDNDFEAKFVKFLDGAGDVEAFIKNETRTVNLKIPYIAKDGFLRRYIPDFIVKTKDGIVIVETKGREDVDVAAKDLQGRRWVEEISKRTRTKWIFLRVDQKEFEKSRYSNFSELTV